MKFEFKVGDVIMKIGDSVRYVIEGEMSDWYDVAPDSPSAPTWVMKKAARKEYIKVGHWDFIKRMEVGEDG